MAVCTASGDRDVARGKNTDAGVKKTGYPESDNASRPTLWKSLQAAQDSAGRVEEIRPRLKKGRNVVLDFGSVGNGSGLHPQEWRCPAVEPPYHIVKLRSRDEGFAIRGDFAGGRTRSGKHPFLCGDFLKKVYRRGETTKLSQ